MLSALLSFLGGSAFRLVWGEVSSWLNKKLEHLQELERMAAQEKIDQAAHERQLASIKLQAELGIQQIQVAGNAAVDKAAADAFTEAMKTANAPSGVRWIDGWNKGIRPAAATISLCLWTGNLIKAAFVLTDWDKDLIGGVLGFFFADRSLAKRGK